MHKAYIHIIHMYALCIHIYIYINMDGERDRESCLHVHLCLHSDVYSYSYLYSHLCLYVYGSPHAQSVASRSSVPLLRVLLWCRCASQTGDSQVRMMPSTAARQVQTKCTEVVAWGPYVKSWFWDWSARKMESSKTRRETEKLTQVSNRGEKNMQNPETTQSTAAGEHARWSSHRDALKPPACFVAHMC